MLIQYDAQKHAMEILNARNFLKLEVKNEIFTPFCREFYELSKNIRITIWIFFVLEKKANTLCSPDL